MIGFLASQMLSLLLLIVEIKAQGPLRRGGSSKWSHKRPQGTQRCTKVSCGQLQHLA